jgi:hypothetical protein
MIPSIVPIMVDRTKYCRKTPLLGNAEADALALAFPAAPSPPLNDKI